MPFAEYSKIAKPVTDLLEFQDANNLLIKRTTTSGVALETNVTSGANLAVTIKSVTKDKNVGELSVEGGTDGQFTSKAKLTKLAANTVQTIEHAVGPKSSGNHTLTLGNTFSQPQFEFNTKLKLTEAEKSATGDFDVSVVGGQNDVAVGVSAKGKAFPAQLLSDYNASLSYTHEKNTFVALTTEKKFKTFNLFLKHTLNKSTQLGAQASYNTESKAQLVTAVVEHHLDNDTTFKTSADSNGVVKTSLLFRLANPELKFTVAQTLKPTVRNFAASSVAIKLAFGDN